MGLHPQQIQQDRTLNITLHSWQSGWHIVNKYSLSEWQFSFNFFIVAKLQLSPFPTPHCFPLPCPPSLSHIQSALSLSLSIGPLYMFLDLTLPLLSPVTLLFSPLWSQAVILYFHVSGSVLLACLFYWLGSTYKWDHMVFVFHCRVYFT